MGVSPETNDGGEPPAGWRALVQVRLWRAAAAGILLAGLFALLFFFLLRDDGGNESVLPAQMVDTPPGVTDASLGVRAGQLARDFEASNLDGARFRLSDLRGQPVVINFWATWCVSCVAEMPVLEEQRKAHQSEDLKIVAVNVGESLGAAEGFIEALELFDFAVAMDPDLSIADAYGIRGLPQTVFIDSNGVVQAVYQGELDDDTMDRYVQAAIDAVPGGEAPFKIRLVSTVPREHVLDVLPDEEDPGRVLFASRRFRCDDGYCGRPAVEAIAELDGVVDFNLRDGATPPSLTIAFEPDIIDLDELVALLAEALSQHPDPLYTRDLEVRYPGGEDG